MQSSNQQSRLLPVISLLFSATLWGIVWYPLRLLEQQGLAGLWSALLSFAAATAVCLWVLFRERRALAANFLPLLLMALAAGWCNVAFIIAVLEGNVVRVLLLFYLSPFWAVCLGWLLLDERLDGRSLLVFVIAVSGAFIMLWDDSLGYPWPDGRADWLAVSSGFAFALSNVFVRKLQTVGTLLKSTTTWVAVVVIAAVWIVLRGAAFPAVGPAVIAAAALLGLCGFLVMSLAVVYGVTRMPVHRSAVILLFELVVGAVSSLLLTDEVILLREWLGGGLIIVAAYVAAHIHARSRP
ncbi:MAG TPA: DMT family transporter [Gammaproteobacteria bacterium]|nr:DMT family transporter [Gammaproteobacteria bacterium]